MAFSFDEAVQQTVISCREEWGESNTTRPSWNLCWCHAAHHIKKAGVPNPPRSLRWAVASKAFAELNGGCNSVYEC